MVIGKANFINILIMVWYVIQTLLGDCRQIALNSEAWIREILKQRPEIQKKKKYIQREKESLTSIYQYNKPTAIEIWDQGEEEKQQVVLVRKNKKGAGRDSLELFAPLKKEY